MKINRQGTDGCSEEKHTPRSKPLPHTAPKMQGVDTRGRHTKRSRENAPSTDGRTNFRPLQKDFKECEWFVILKFANLHEAYVGAVTSTPDPPNGHNSLSPPHLTHLAPVSSSRHAVREHLRSQGNDPLETVFVTAHSILLTSAPRLIS